MKRLLISYTAFFPIIFISRVLLNNSWIEFDFMQELVFSLKWTLVVGVTFFLIDIIDSFSLEERRFYFKKSKKATIIVSSIALIIGFVFQRIEIIPILVIIAVLITSDLIRIFF